MVSVFLFFPKWVIIFVPVKIIHIQLRETWKVLESRVSKLDPSAHPCLACFCIAHGLRSVYIFKGLYRTKIKQKKKVEEYVAEALWGLQSLKYLSGPLWRSLLIQLQSIQRKTSGKKWKPSRQSQTSTQPAYLQSSHCAPDSGGTDAQVAPLLSLGFGIHFSLLLYAFFINKVRFIQFIDCISCLFSLNITVYTLSDWIKRSYAYLAFTTCQALF